MKTSRNLIALAGATLLLAAAANTQAQFTLLHSFTDDPDDGRNPLSSLTLSGTTLYGMTVYGGSGDRGTIFKINTAGTDYTILHSFVEGSSDGIGPVSSLTLSGTTLYGTTVFGGSSGLGTIFKINTAGTDYTILHSFGGDSEGCYPDGSLILSGTTLYCMTGGGSGGRGTISKINTDGTGYAILHSFFGGSSDGSNPTSSLTPSGTILYGMTSDGGSSDRGTIFKINTDGTGYTNLHSFAGGASDGSLPSGSLTLSGTILYGMTIRGGSNNAGTIFKINTNGTSYAILHSFAGGASDGSLPSDSLMLSDSSLYGMTADGGSSDRGTIFKINTDGTGYTNLHSFAGGASDGWNPSGSLTLSNSSLYGMTGGGGSSDRGVIFSLTLLSIDSVTVSNALSTLGTNTIVAAGDILGFTMEAHPTNALNYRWDFGDGSQTTWSALNAATHTYSPLNSCGPYTATATVSNALGTASTNLPIILTCQLTVTKLQLKANFNPAKWNADSCMLTGTVPLDRGFSVNGRVVTVDIGGAQVSFTLDAKGRGTTAKHTCKLSHSTKTGLSRLTVSLKNASWATPWSAHGLTNVTTPKTGVPVSLPVMVSIGSEAFAADKSLLYKATADKSGIAK